ncbi:MAG: hypothetical protein JWM58_2965 [Rhizobium sp.]|nr:hypothetical protein [Rhizobium sp.]
MRANNEFPFCGIGVGPVGLAAAHLVSRNPVPLFSNAAKQSVHL